MVTKAADLVKIPALGRVEKSGLIVTAILVAVNALIGSPELAVGAGAGGVLFVANFVAIKFVVNTLVGNAYPKAFGIFAFLLKMSAFIGIVISIFIFAKVNIYGFFIGITGVVIVIIGEGLKGYKNGAL